VGTDSEIIPNNPQHDTDSDPYPEFTWLNPSMIVDDSPTPDIGSAEWSPESSIAEPYTPSQFEAPVAIERSPVACGSLNNINILDSFSLSHLYRHSIFDLQLEGHHIDEAARNAARRRLDEETPLSTSSTSFNAAFGISLDREPSAAIVPTDEVDININVGIGASSDEELVRMSIKSLDLGEEPIFDLPSGWKEAFVPPAPADITVTVTPSSRARSANKTSGRVLPRLKLLWKRAASKFVSRPM
jgi:hypothetical protein